MVCYLREGMKGDLLIGKYQKALQSKGFYKGYRVDNVFGPATARETGRYQAAKRLVVDRCVGCQTWDSVVGKPCPWAKPDPVKPPVVDEWYRSAQYGGHDQQLTGRSCAAAAFSMALGENGGKIEEPTLMKLMKTNEAGTSHPNIRVAMKGLGVPMVEVFSKDMSVLELAELTRDPEKAVVGHFQMKAATDPLQTMVYDANKKLVWTTYRGGHYEYVEAVNPIRDLILMDDPTKNQVYYKSSQIWAGARYTEQKLGVSGFIVIG